MATFERGRENTGVDDTRESPLVFAVTLISNFGEPLWNGFIEDEVDEDNEHSVMDGRNKFLSASGARAIRNLKPEELGLEMNSLS